MVRRERVGRYTRKYIHVVSVRNAVVTQQARDGKCTQSATTAQANEPRARKLSSFGGRSLTPFRFPSARDVAEERA